MLGVVMGVKQVGKKGLLKEKRLDILLVELKAMTLGKLLGAVKDSKMDV